MSALDIPLQSLVVVVEKSAIPASSRSSADRVLPNLSAFDPLTLRYTSGKSTIRPGVSLFHVADCEEVVAMQLSVRPGGCVRECRTLFESSASFFGSLTVFLLS